MSLAYEPCPFDSNAAYEAEARRRFPWCYPPASDKEDAQRVREGKKPRDWAPTREYAVEQIKRMGYLDCDTKTLADCKIRFPSPISFPGTGRAS